MALVGATVRDDKELLREEAAALKAELQWILHPEHGEALAVFKELTRLIKTCHEKLSYQPEDPNLKPNQTPQSASYHSSPLTTENDAVKGFVALNGHCITRTTLQLRFSRWNKGQPFSTQISPSNPWVVHQIQNAGNFLSVALTEILNASRQHMALSGRETSGNGLSQHLLQTKDYISKVLDRTMGLLNLAKDQLYRPTRRTAAEAAAELSNQGVCHPRPPPGLIVDFYVDYGHLITCIYTLTPLSGQPATVKPTHCKVDQQWYEVDEKIDLESTIPALGDSVARINTGYELCQRLKDNLQALRIRNT
eukprot:comp5808_c0_seq1/m.1665 comp5808_c0_seq1/g.1665  ORF comp5808_c0_seq1/g.1665 comp5808_c0_seq1/m.1665 type:complete len:308 (-) comp5808_c0_seq1:457-1380(-)